MTHVICTACFYERSDSPIGAVLPSRRPRQRSGGEQQRVAIARAVAKRPDILLCDEPTGALDSETGKLVLSVLDQVNRETGTTTAIITHNAVIGQLADTVVQMSSGAIVEHRHDSRRASVDSIDW